MLYFASLDSSLETDMKAVSKPVGDDGTSSSSSSDSSSEGWSSSSSSPERPQVNNSQGSSGLSDAPGLPSYHNSPFVSSQSSSNGSRNNAQSTPESVGADQERQILLLMLLAQVCALHDATPKTFTVHVLELFERGILDRESIHFLFELGLVPSHATTIGSSSSSSSGPLLLVDGMADSEQQTNVASASSKSTSKDDKGGASSEFLADLRRNQETETEIDPQEQLSPAKQASSIRSSLASSIRLHLQQQEASESSSRRSKKDQPVPTQQQTEQEDSQSKPWHTEHFPLSLSRYQREFAQIRLLNSGAFGSVFHVKSKLDGCDYAIKKVAFDAVGYSNESIAHVMREVKCLALCDGHPNVVSYYTSWLEPGWMTGSGHLDQLGSGAIEQKLLTDLEDLVDAKAPRDRQPTANNGVHDDSYSDLRMPRRNERYPRRFSFESSTGLGEESWRDYRDWSFSQGRRQFDSSTTRGALPQSSARAPIYRYQICLYIQMQLCHPATLADWLRERNRQMEENDRGVRVKQAMMIFSQIVSGLAHVHSKGIVHRDMKPANIFASDNGKVIKIGDFGLSKELEDIAAQTPSHAQSSPSSKRPSPNSLTQESFWHNPRAAEGAIVPARGTRVDNQLAVYGPRHWQAPLTQGVGTASYASPEQVKSKQYGTPADIFSLGLILLELVCCFDTEHERLDHFRSIREHRVVPKWISRDYPHICSLILACTRSNPLDRPTAADLLSTIASDQHPNTAIVVHSDRVRILEMELQQKNEVIAEQDSTIETMRQEMHILKERLAQAERLALVRPKVEDVDD